MSTLHMETSAHTRDGGFLCGNIAFGEGSLCEKRREARQQQWDCENVPLLFCHFSLFCVCSAEKKRARYKLYGYRFFPTFFFRFSFFIAAPHLSPSSLFLSNDCPSHPKVCSAVHAEHMLTLDYWKRKPIRFDVNCWNGSTIDDDGELFRSIFAELHYALGALFCWWRENMPYAVCEW